MLFSWTTFVETAVYNGGEVVVMVNGGGGVWHGVGGIVQLRTEEMIRIRIDKFNDNFLKLFCLILRSF